MERIERSIEVDVPLRTAYDLWTRFEEFPRFMEGIEKVNQVDDAHTDWTAKIGGKSKTWRAEIVDQVPDERIVWKALEGAGHRGAVTFSPLGKDQTLVQLALDYEPEGVIETIGDAFGGVERRVEGDLKKFKETVESAEAAPRGGWRGTIKDGRVIEPDVESGAAGGTSGMQSSRSPR